MPVFDTVQSSPLLLGTLEIKCDMSVLVRLGHRGFDVCAGGESKRAALYELCQTERDRLEVTARGPDWFGERNFVDYVSVKTRLLAVANYPPKLDDCPNFFQPFFC